MAAVVGDRDRDGDGGDRRFAGRIISLGEQVVGLPDRPAPVGGGWWRVGLVLDGAGDEE